AHHQQQRRRQAGKDELRHLRALDVGTAEIALQQAPEVTPVLDQERLVEAKLATDALNGRGRGAATRNLAYRIGRKQIEQRESDERNAQQDQHGLDESAAEIGDHERPRCVGSSMSRKASPIRLNARASARMAMPGKKTSQGAAWK